MKVELHCHTSRFSLCAVNTPDEMLARLVEEKYDAVFLTEHDALWSPQDIAFMQKRHPKIKIFPGLELTHHHDEGEGISHILILGTTDASFLFITDPEAIIAHAKKSDCLTIVAHPYRWTGADEFLKSSTLPDAMEGLTPNHSPRNAVLAHQAGKQLSLPIVNTSDAHAAKFIGRYWIETNIDFETPQQLREIIVAREYKNRVMAKKQPLLNE
ncbi:MAG: PHP domain-containing protein [Phycisphaerae bacterium]|nr:PHP domain-containing protein [Phycisphaerae bacterium]